MIYPEQYQNNTKITPERSPLLKIAMLTCLFKGETSSKSEIYYNNIQDKIYHTLYFYLYSIYPK